MEKLYQTTLMKQIIFEKLIKDASTYSITDEAIILLNKIVNAKGSLILLH